MAEGVSSFKIVGLFMDENVPLQATARLRALGHDVLTAHESGLANRGTPDLDILKFAVGAGRALVTMNRRHFIRLHYSYPEHCGIVVCTVDADRVALADRIHDAVSRTPLMRGQLLRVNRPTT